MIIFAIDPGTVSSAFVIFDSKDKWIKGQLNEIHPNNNSFFDNCAWGTLVSGNADGG